MVVKRFFYDACIPTNVVNSFYFKPMLDAISAIGLGYKGTNYHKLRVNLLKDTKKEVQLLVDFYRAIWAKVGCTIMGDGWTYNRQRTLINFLVYYLEGISFVKSIDASTIFKDATNLFQLFDEKVLKGKLDMMNEMKLFRDQLGSFGRNLAYSSHEILQPNERWRLHEYNGPHLQKRNRLEHQRLNDLVYIHYNLRLKYRFYNKKRTYDPIDYACIDETDFWIVDEDQSVKLDVEELENLLYEERSIPINEVEGSSSHIDDEDVAVERLDVENFDFPYAHFQSPYSNFQNE
ncbi:hypothetical protein AAG906_022582 [Vitis piasezkii]